MHQSQVAGTTNDNDSTFLLCASVSLWFTKRRFPFLFATRKSLCKLSPFA